MDMLRALRFAHVAARVIPEPIAELGCDAVAFVAALARKTSMKQLDKNLARAAGIPLGFSGRFEAMRRYMHYFYEAVRLPALTSEQIQARVLVRSVEHAQRELEKGSLVGALFHAGNWDLAGAWATPNLAPVYTIAEKLDPPELYKLFADLRRSIGIEVLPLQHGVLASLMEASRGQGRFFPLLADRDLSATGVEVELFGERAMVAPGPALFALREGIGLIPVMIAHRRLYGEDRRRAGASWGIVIELGEVIYPPRRNLAHESEQVAALTQQWVSAGEAFLRAHPCDWHMLQPLFIPDLDPERLAKTRAKAAARREMEAVQGEEHAPGTRGGD